MALADLIKQQFDGHSFVARQGIAEAERMGWIERYKGVGPHGGALHRRRGDVGRRGPGAADGRPGPQQS